MGSNSCFSKIIADVFPPWHRVNTHLDAAEQQTDRTSVGKDQVIFLFCPNTWNLGLKVGYFLLTMGNI